MTGPVVVLVTGSRCWEEEKIVHAELDRMAAELKGQPWILVHGDADGVDTMADNWATHHGISVKKFPYPKGTGPAGGPQRNRRMVNTARPHYALAFWADNSSGTGNCIGCLNQYRRSARSRMSGPVCIIRPTSETRTQLPQPAVLQLLPSGLSLPPCLGL